MRKQRKIIYTEKKVARILKGCIDYTKGLTYSVKKWEQRAGGNINSYAVGEYCGLCIITSHFNKLFGQILHFNQTKDNAFYDFIPSKIYEAIDPSLWCSEVADFYCPFAILSDCCSIVTGTVDPKEIIKLLRSKEVKDNIKHINKVLKPYVNKGINHE